MVAPAQFDTVDAHFGRGSFDQPLHIVVGLGPPGAAIGADRRCVREGALGRDFDQRRLVDAERISDGIPGRRSGGAVSGAEIAEDREKHREEIAVAIERQFGGRLGVAAMGVGHEAARTIVGPFDRAAEFAGRVQEAIILGISRLLHAEGAADTVGQHTQLIAPDPQDSGDVVAEPEHPLAGDVKGPMAALGIVFCDRRARLHCIDDNAVVAQLEPRHVGGAGKGGGHRLAVAKVKVEPDITGDVVIEKRSTGRGRCASSRDRRQRVDVDEDRFGGVLGLGDGFGDDGGNRLADMADLALRQRIADGAQHRRAVAVVHDLPRRQRADAARLEFGRGVDGEHARHALRLRGVDAADDAVRITAAHDHAIGLARKIDVIGKAAGAGDEHRIFAPRHRLADCKAILFEQIQIGHIVHFSLLRPLLVTPAQAGVQGSGSS